jgi:serine/threonine protein kinase
MQDVKAGNILLTNDGVAKLADFGVSAELTQTHNKRQTVIGTPFWMAPEVIREVDYDARADIWSLGITMLELSEGNPPHYNVHPMRAIFMIPVKPAPRLADPSKWSPEMDDFLCRCLVKDVDDRGTSEELVGHPWIATEVKKIKKRGQNPGLSILSKLVTDNFDAIVKFRNAGNQPDDEGVPDIDTLSEGDKTLKKHNDGGSFRGGLGGGGAGTMERGTLDRGRARDSDASTLKHLARKATLRRTSDGGSFYESGTMKRVDTSDFGSGTMIMNSTAGEASSPDPVDMSTMRLNSPGDDNRDRYQGTMQRVGASKEELVLSELRNALKYFQRDGSERGTSIPRGQAIADALPQPQYPPNPPIPKLPEPINSRKVELADFLARISDSDSQKLEINDANATAVQDIRTQLEQLARQYEDDTREIQRAYLTTKQSMEDSLKRLMGSQQSTSASTTPR